MITAKTSPSDIKTTSSLSAEQYPSLTKYSYATLVVDAPNRKGVTSDAHYG